MDIFSQSKMDIPLRTALPLLRQPVGAPCVGQWPFACAVGGKNSGTESALKLLRNQKFLILGQNLPVFCYGLGDARSGRA